MPQISAAVVIAPHSPLEPRDTKTLVEAEATFVAIGAGAVGLGATDPRRRTLLVLNTKSGD